MECIKASENLKERKSALIVFFFIIFESDEDDSDTFLPQNVSFAEERRSEINRFEPEN